LRRGALCRGAKKKERKKERKKKKGREEDMRKTKR
jgi:hypothetical protein